MKGKEIIHLVGSKKKIRKNRSNYKKCIFIFEFESSYRD